MPGLYPSSVKGWGLGARTPAFCPPECLKCLISPGLGKLLMEGESRAGLGWQGGRDEGHWQSWDGEKE